MAAPSGATGSFRLGPDFSPGPFDVICGRGKDCYGHGGNQNLRALVRLVAKEYSLAKTKEEKSAIVTNVADEIRRRSPNGGFVKKDTDGWYEVGEFLAREKISQGFRDILHDRYKSSTKMRRKVRAAQRRLGEDDSTSTRSGQCASLPTQAEASPIDTQGFKDLEPDVVASLVKIPPNNTTANSFVTPFFFDHSAVSKTFVPQPVTCIGANGFPAAISFLSLASWLDQSQHPLFDSVFMPSRECHSLPDEDKFFSVNQYGRSSPVQSDCSSLPDLFRGDSTFSMWTEEARSSQTMDDAGLTTDLWTLTMADQDQQHQKLPLPHSIQHHCIESLLNSIGD